MGQPSEAKEVEGKIYFNGWFRTSLLGFAALMISVLTLLVTNVIANDNKYTEKIRQTDWELARTNSEVAKLDVKFESIKDDLIEIKQLLRRRIPRESNSD